MSKLLVCTVCIYICIKKYNICVIYSTVYAYMCVQLNTETEKQIKSGKIKKRNMPEKPFPEHLKSKEKKKNIT